jgi:Ca2+-binding RTX toxin-like protein
MATIDGTSGNDTLNGTDGDDVINGLDGNDAITDGAGSDTVNAGAGDFDVIHASLGAGVDIYDGGAGIHDIVYYTNALAGVHASLADGEAYSIGGNDEAGIGIDQLGNIEDLYGSTFSDELIGSSGNNSLYGREGNDALNGGGGNDNLSGGDGNDIMDGGAGIDRVSYSASDNGVRVDLSIATAQVTGQGTDTIVGVENLFGSLFNDRLTGDSQDNWLLGLDGDDKLYGGDGGDQLDGDVGDDYLNGGDGNNFLDGGDGDDVLVGGSGDDYFEGGIGIDTADYSAAAGGISQRLGGATWLPTGGAGTDVLLDIENLVGSAYADSFFGSDDANSMKGGLGHDELYGGGGDDYLFGGGDDDILIGDGGYDRLYGGTGDDTYQVNDSTDFAYENAGEGHDTVIASLDHTLRVNVEDLQLIGFAAIGKGNAGANTITGTDNANRLYGYGGDDSLHGASGDDFLSGGDGVDSLIGGTGRDTTTGGAGNDTFVFADGDFGGYTRATADRITDFASGDKIDLSAVDANVTLASDQAFSFIGTGAFTHSAGELRYEQIAGNTYVSGDPNGDGFADFMIKLDGLHSVQGTDLIL